MFFFEKTSDDTECAKHLYIKKIKLLLRYNVTDDKNFEKLWI